MRAENKGAVVGLGVSLVYFQASESGQSSEANCSYLAPVSTDIAAIAAAALLYWQSRKNSNFWVGLVAGAITGIHAQQFLHFKTQAAESENVARSD